MAINFHLVGDVWLYVILFKKIVESIGPAAVSVVREAA